MNNKKKQEQASRLVEKFVLHNLCLTAEKMIGKDPDLLYNAKNYKEDKETGKYPKIYEFWAVGEWLGDRLEEKGEIIFKIPNFIVWGRQTTGQAIKLDEVIQEIAEKYKL